MCQPLHKLTIHVNLIIRVISVWKQYPSLKMALFEQRVGSNKCAHVQKKGKVLETLGNWNKVVT